MPLESATFITNLVASNPASTDTVSQADDHIRLIKQVLKTTFPNLNAPVTATPAQLNSSVPTGFIGMWSGSIATIPAGWGICDGSSGRPDLRDRFIVGAGSTYSIGNTGGANAVTLIEANLPAHTHSFSGTGSSNEVDLSHSHDFSGTTVAEGIHNHNLQKYPSGSSYSTYYDIANTNAFNTSGALISDGGKPTTSAGSHQHTYSGTTSPFNGNHSHTITVSGVIDSTGSGTGHENRPPYYALAFIIKL
jgi:microcystin-dependent protein